MRLIAIGIVVCGTIAQAQTPAFEAASVKRNTSGEARIRFETPPGRLNAINVPLRFAIRQAYRIPDSRVIGGPAWLDTERFDIVAVAPTGITTTDVIRQMLRTILAERFGLRVHEESREMPIHALSVASANGTLGPGLRRSNLDCTGKPASMVAGRVQCGVLVSQAPDSASLRGGGAAFSEFVRLLGDFLDRPVVDDTGLTGVFDLELQFTAPRSGTPAAPVPGGLNPDGRQTDVPTVFTAIREQMGLQLNARRGRVDVVVVDAVQPLATDVP